MLEAARELGYSPSALARALVTRRSRIIGVMVGDIVDAYFAEITRGVEDVAGRAGYMTFVCNADRRTEVEIDAARGAERLPRRGRDLRRQRLPR